MKRHADWHIRLRQYLREAWLKPFCPGEHDCWMFTAGAVKAMTGEDIAKDWHGVYKTVPRGLAIMHKRGFESLADLAASHLPELSNPVTAKPGDVAALMTDEGLALGIVQGARIYVAGQYGLLTVPLIEIGRAFEV